MSGRAVFSVATGPFVRGQVRMAAALQKFGGFGEQLIAWTDAYPPESPTHQRNPYAFKAYALKHALTHRTRPTTLLWLDACVVPVKPLERVWKLIEDQGYFIMRNGFSNYDWTSDAAYARLFPNIPIGQARLLNAKVEHVVGGCFGISLDHKIGREFLMQLSQLAESGAFLGPWTNSNHPDAAHQVVDGVRCAPCGPHDVRGYRHDQSCMSVIAHRLGMVLTSPPDIFSYANPDASVDERTILVADGGTIHG